MVELLNLLRLCFYLLLLVCINIRFVKVCGPGSECTVLQVTDSLLEVFSRPTSCLVVHQRYFPNCNFRIIGLDNINNELDIL